MPQRRLVTAYKIIIVRPDLCQVRASSHIVARSFRGGGPFMEVWSAAALALALSVDGLAVGVAYGMRNIDVPLRSLLIIGSCSALCFSAALLLGRFIAGVADVTTPHLIGSSILIVLGSWHIIKGWLERGRTESKPSDHPAPWAPLMRVRIRPLGIVVHVLREPAKADLDGSGAIDPAEAIVLGVALGLDAMAVGFGAAFIGVGFAFVGVVAGAQLLLTWIGLQTGRRFGARLLGEHGFYVPGLILILIGLLQLG